MEENENLTPSPILPKVVLGAAVVLFLLAALWVGFSLLGSQNKQASDPGSISNGTATSSPSALVESTVVAEVTENALPTDEPSPPVDTQLVTTRFQECINGATDLSMQAVRDYSRTCFYGYGYHLPTIYGIRNLGEVEVRNVQVTDEATARVNAELYSQFGDQIATVDAYWVERVGDQLKVVGVNPTGYTSNRISQSIMDQVKLAFGY